MGQERRFQPQPERGLDYCPRCGAFAYLGAGGLCCICKLPPEEQRLTWESLRTPPGKPERTPGYELTKGRSR